MDDRPGSTATRASTNNAQRGFVLPAVTFFALIGFLFVSVFLFAQRSTLTSFGADAASLQALLNARSGIWKGVAMLRADAHVSFSDVSESDTIESFSSAWGLDTAASRGSFAHGTLVPGEKPVSVELFDTASFGRCSLSLHAQGSFLELRAAGVFRKNTRVVYALLGSRPFDFFGDTLVYTDAAGKPTGTGTLKGYFCHIGHRRNVQRAARRGADAKSESPAFGIDTERRSFFLDACSKRIPAGPDSVMAQQLVPTTVTSGSQFHDLPDFVNASLNIESTLNGVSVAQRRHIKVAGDLVISGDAQLRDLTFSCKGSIHIRDQAQLDNVSLYTAETILIGGNARYHGDAIAQGEIEIYQSAVISDASTLICLDNQTAVSGKQRIVDSTGSESREVDLSEREAAGVDSAAQDHDYAIQIRDEAEVDAVIVDASRRKGGISTDAAVVISGILFTQGPVRHEGTLYGIVRANRLTGKKTALSSSGTGPGTATAKNILNGHIEALHRHADYALPYFVGSPHIMEWREGGGD